MSARRLLSAQVLNQAVSKLSNAELEDAQAAAFDATLMFEVRRGAAESAQREYPESVYLRTFLLDPMLEARLMLQVLRRDF